MEPHRTPAFLRCLHPFCMAGHGEFTRPSKRQRDPSTPNPWRRSKQRYGSDTVEADRNPLFTSVPLHLQLSHLDRNNIKTWDNVAKWLSHGQHTHTIVWFIICRRVKLRAGRLRSEISCCQCHVFAYSHSRVYSEFQECKIASCVRRTLSYLPPLTYYNILNCEMSSQGLIQPEGYRN